VDWLPACIALRVAGDVLVAFLRRWRKICTILQPIGKQGPIPEEISQTLLTNKKQGNPQTLLSQHKLGLTGRNTLFAL
jgi:hypothetical protein